MRQLKSPEKSSKCLKSSERLRAIRDYFHHRSVWTQLVPDPRVFTTDRLVVETPYLPPPSPCLYCLSATDSYFDVWNAIRYIKTRHIRNACQIPEKEISAAFCPCAFMFWEVKLIQPLAFLDFFFYIGKTFFQEMIQGKMTDFSILTHSVCQFMKHFVLIYAQKWTSVCISMYLSVFLYSSCSSIQKGSISRCCFVVCIL